MKDELLEQIRMSLNEEIFLYMSRGVVGRVTLGGCAGWTFETGHEAKIRKREMKKTFW